MQNPFTNKPGYSPVFTTGKSLWSNPFCAQNKSFDEKDNKANSLVPAWLKSHKDASAEANSDPSPTMNAKTSELSNKLF